MLIFSSALNTQRLPCKESKRQNQLINQPASKTNTFRVETPQIPTHMTPEGSPSAPTPSSRGPMRPIGFKWCLGVFLPPRTLKKTLKNLLRHSGKEETFLA